MITALMCVVGACLPWILGSRKSRPRVEQPRRLDVAVLVDLVGAGLAAGVSIPDALGGLGRAASEDDLVFVARALRLGVEWDETWREVDERLTPLRDALEPAWVDGVAPRPLLRAGAQAIRERRTQAAREAAERLGVALVLPLGLCLLPAFVLLGLVPVVIALV